MLDINFITAMKINGIFNPERKETMIINVSKFCPLWKKVVILLSGIEYCKSDITMKTAPVADAAIISPEDFSKITRSERIRYKRYKRNSVTTGNHGDCDISFLLSIK